MRINALLCRPEDKIAGLVSLVGFDQGIIACDGLLHDKVSAVKGLALPCLGGDGDGPICVVFDGRTSLVHQSSVSSRGVEGGDASTTSANSLR